MTVNLIVLTFLLINYCETGNIHNMSFQERTEPVCIWDTFRPQCQLNQVAVIKKARYGPIDINQCSRYKEDHCIADVTTIISSKCSGINSCQVKAVDQELIAAQSCSTVSYLEVSYGCITVASSDGIHCVSNHVARLANGAPNIISSYVADETGCGSSVSPWIIEAVPGQQINITITDFGFVTESMATSTSRRSACIPYGFIVEKATKLNKTICGGKQSNIVVIQSNSHVVEVGIFPLSRRQNRHFLLHYQINGCPDFSSRPKLVYRRENDAVTVTCKITQQSWRLTCVNNRWTGVIGNCSVREESTPQLLESVLNLDNDKNMIIVIGLMAIIIVLTIIAIVGCFTIIRRRNIDSSVPTVFVSTAESQKMQEADYLRRSLHSGQLQHPPMINTKKKKVPTATLR